MELKGRNHLGIKQCSFKSGFQYERFSRVRWKNSVDREGRGEDVIGRKCVPVIE